MREIKFRGLRVDGEGWEIGNYIEKKDPTRVKDVFLCCFIQDGALSLNEVDPETVGQFTGLQDKNGVDIYEGDLVNVQPTLKKCRIEVVQVLIPSGFISLHPFQDDGHHWSSESSEVVGNIHEQKQAEK